MATYKHPCIYCDKLIPGDSNTCPYCGSADPFVLRCPKCRKPVDSDYMKCPSCGFNLRVLCPFCGSETFTGSVCQICQKRLTVVCRNPKCGYEQYPASEKCVKCNKPLK